MSVVEFCQYREEDYEAVCSFLIVLNQIDKSHINWNWARFEWMIEHSEFDKSTIGSIGLWWKQNKIVGAAIYDMYFGEAFCAALPDQQALLRRMENWLLIAACGIGRIQITPMWSRSVRFLLTVERDSPPHFCRKP